MSQSVQMRNHNSTIIHQVETWARHMAHTQGDYWVQCCCCYNNQHFKILLLPYTVKGCGAYAAGSSTCQFHKPTWC